MDRSLPLGPTCLHVVRFTQRSGGVLHLQCSLEKHCGPSEGSWIVRRVIFPHLRCKQRSSSVLTCSTIQSNEHIILGGWFFIPHQIIADYLNTGNMRYRSDASYAKSFFFSCVFESFQVYLRAVWSPAGPERGLSQPPRSHKCHGGLDGPRPFHNHKRTFFVTTETNQQDF